MPLWSPPDGSSPLCWPSGSPPTPAAPPPTPRAAPGPIVDAAINGSAPNCTSTPSKTPSVSVSALSWIGAGRASRRHRSTRRGHCRDRSPLAGQPGHRPARIDLVRRGSARRTAGSVHRAGSVDGRGSVTGAVPLTGAEPFAAPSVAPTVRRDAPPLDVGRRRVGTVDGRGGSVDPGSGPRRAPPAGFPPAPGSSTADPADVASRCALRPDSSEMPGTVAAKLKRCLADHSPTPYLVPLASRHRGLSPRTAGTTYATASLMGIRQEHRAKPVIPGPAEIPAPSTGIAALSGKGFCAG